MPQIFYGWPISGLIVRQAAAYGIDAEGEKPIEFRMERSQAERLTAEEREPETQQFLLLVGGLRTLVDHGTTGLLVDERHPEAFAAAVRSVLAAPAAATRMGTIVDALLRYSRLSRQEIAMRPVSRCFSSAERCLTVNRMTGIWSVSRAFSS